MKTVITLKVESEFFPDNLCTHESIEINCAPEVLGKRIEAYTRDLVQRNLNYIETLSACNVHQIG